MLKTLLRIRCFSLVGPYLVCRWYIGCWSQGIAYFSYGLYFKAIWYFLCPHFYFRLHSVLYIHFARNDHRFLKSVAFHPPDLFRRIFLSFHAPFLVLLALNGWWWLILLLPVHLVDRNDLALFPSGWKSGSFILRVPASSFHWFQCHSLNGGADWEKHGTFIFIVYAFAIGLSGLTLVSLFVLLLVSMSFSSFYSDGESAAVINAESFHLNNFKTQVENSRHRVHHVFIPGLLIYLFRHPHDWIYVLLASLIFIINVSYFILIKYSFYRPDEKLAAGSVWVAILFASTLIPFCSHCHWWLLWEIILLLKQFETIRRWYCLIQFLSDMKVTTSWPA